MARSSAVFVCRECGGESLRWAGQCPHCRAWNTLEEFRAGRHSASPKLARSAGAAGTTISINEVELDGSRRLLLAWSELNRVLGGGIVPGSLVLIGGEPGVGKSTLLLHLAQQASAEGGRVLYASGEESPQQVAMRAQRLGTLEPRIRLVAETDIDLLTEAIEKESPAVVIVDSIQTINDPAVDAAVGSVSQVREAAGRLMRLAKESSIPIFLVGHVTKEGAIAGPRVLEHMVDTVLYLEGERHQGFRILRATKNRFGSAEEIGIFSMGDRGLEEVTDPSGMLLGGVEAAPGMVVLATIEGSRPLLVELQSLVSPTPFGLPRRSATGFDLNRLHMIVAVVEKRARIPLGNRDVFVNVTGGMRLAEPAADLALALSIAGNVRDQALPKGTVAIGELGLAGEVRRVGQMERRLQEAARHGFTRAIIPPGATLPAGLDCKPVRDLEEAIVTAFEG
jgi:DNA repair protein RadA/Sms